MGKIIKNGIAYSTASDNAYNINFNNADTTLNAVTVQQAIVELNDKIDNFDGTVVGGGKDVIVELSLENWVLDETTNTYSQQVEVEGIKENSNPIVVVASENEIITEEEIEAFNCLYDAITLDNFIIFTALELPKTSFLVAIKGAIGGSGETPSADLTELENRVTALENKVVESGKDIEITLTVDGWVLDEDNKYSQVADVAGLTETATPLVLLKSTSEETLKAYNCITESIVEKDKITFIANEVPTMDIDLVVKNVVPSDSTIVDDISELREEVGNKLAIDGDSKDNVVTYISNDSAEVSEYAEVEPLISGEKHSSLFNKVSTMFKNIRYITKTLGNTDISAIGDGTIKGAISQLNSDKLNSSNPMINGMLKSSDITKANKQIMNVGSDSLFLGNPSLDGLYLEYAGGSVSISKLCGISEGANKTTITRVSGSFTAQGSHHIDLGSTQNVFGLSAYIAEGAIPIPCAIQSQRHLRFNIEAVTTVSTKINYEYFKFSNV